MYRFLQRAILFVVGVTMPIAGVSASVGGFPITPAKLATALMLILVGMQFALSGDRKLPRDRGLVPLVIFVISVAISSVVTLAQELVSPPLVLASATRFFGLAAFYVMLLYVMRTRDDLVLLFWAMVIGGAITGFPGLVEIREGTYLAAGQRTQGLAGKSNKMGYELAICLPLAFALYFTVRSRLRQLLLLSAVGVMLVAIVGSLSRSTFLSLGAMWGFWLWRSRRIDTLRYAIPAVAVAIVAFLFLPSQVYDRIDTMFDPAKRDEDRSINSRFLQVVWAGKAFLSNPIAGVGVNNYVEWVRRQPGGAMLHNNIHSGFVSILATQGLLGFIPFMAIIVFSWFDYNAAQRMVRIRRSRDDPPLRELGIYALFLQVALVGTLVGALVHPTDDSKGWWTVLALSAVMVALVRQRAEAIDGALGSPAAPDRVAPGGVDYRPDIVPATR